MGTLLLNQFQDEKDLKFPNKIYSLLSCKNKNSPPHHNISLCVTLVKPTMHFVEMGIFCSLVTDKVVAKTKIQLQRLKCKCTKYQTIPGSAKLIVCTFLV